MARAPRGTTFAPLSKPAPDRQFEGVKLSTLLAPIAHAIFPSNQFLSRLAGNAAPAAPPVSRTLTKGLSEKPA